MSGRSLRKGTQVRWHWGAGSAEGKVADVFERRVSRTIKGKRITRNGTADNPAVLVEQADGDKALKRASELELS
ncbi:hypervirulence associated TUDOR domain-containing protein [Novosphingobium huizhouense]|uniref:DUF2945 domain-containing protein n=1 Tax=Novosphingobium huizhouense TaxID=2866625 RepID=UPI001CD8B8F1|nr:DUF2945 domain-containing protein [Novosphingobium huizhouense]